MFRQSSLEALMNDEARFNYVYAYREGDRTAGKVLLQLLHVWAPTHKAQAGMRGQAG